MCLYEYLFIRGRACTFTKESSIEWFRILEGLARIHCLSASFIRCLLSSETPAPRELRSINIQKAVEKKRNALFWTFQSRYTKISEIFVIFIACNNRFVRNRTNSIKKSLTVYDVRVRLYHTCACYTRNTITST